MSLADDKWPCEDCTCITRPLCPTDNILSLYSHCDIFRKFVVSVGKITNERMKMPKKKKETVVMHQHIDEKGRVFGSKHPVNSEHTNEKTQKYHNMTVERG